MLPARGSSRLLVEALEAEELLRRHRRDDALLEACEEQTETLMALANYLDERRLIGGEAAIGQGRDCRKPRQDGCAGQTPGIFVWCCRAVRSNTQRKLTRQPHRASAWARASRRDMRTAGMPEPNQPYDFKEERGRWLIQTSCVS